MRLFGLIGYPLTHSFSKRYFEKKFEQEGLTDCRFENFPIGSIEELPELLKKPGLRGFAATIPYKQQLLRYLDSAENIPGGLKACNCVKITEGRLIGYNTDWIGFEKSFAPSLQPQHTKALVLGNGGATEAIAFVLNRLNVSFKIVSRQLHNGSSLTYADITEKLVDEYKVIINTTPLGMYPAVETCPDLPYEAITADHFLYDLVYNPAKTLFLQKGEERGALIKNGEDMLVLQAEENWRIWNG
jgi:shikimate dehydrogenase